MKIDLGSELREIRKLIGSVCVMESVRREVKAALSGVKTMVLDGDHAQSRVACGSGYDVVVIASGSDDGSIEVLSRRIRAALPDSEVERIGVDGVLGIRGSRRGSRKVENE
jgi:hypothetical protein